MSEKNLEKKRELHVRTALGASPIIRSFDQQRNKFVGGSHQLERERERFFKSKEEKVFKSVLVSNFFRHIIDQVRSRGGKIWH